jgi:hypothetical protein
MAATNEPGHRPANVVARTIAGTKNRKLIRPCVYGWMVQWMAAAASPRTAAKPKLRPVDFSIHGQRRASRKSWGEYEIRNGPFRGLF